MTKRTVTNQDRFVSTRGTGDWAVATEADECLVNGKPQKFENWATSDQLIGGTSGKTTIAGEPIWTKPGKLGPPSLPAHPGTLGKKSGKPAHGEAEAITTSGNLKAEGEPVVRLKDKTTQNRKNTFGEVMPEHKRFNFEDAAGAEGGADADSGGARGGSKKAKDAPVGAGDGAFPPSGTVPVEHCTVQAVRATCNHKSRPSKDGTLQVVVPSGTTVHNVILEASVDGPCLAVPDHPHWTTEGATLKPGRVTHLAVQPPALQALEWVKGRGFGKLSDRKPRNYKIHCAGCDSGRHDLFVQAYDGAYLVVTVDRTKHGDALTTALQVVSFLLSLFVDGGEMGGAPEGGNSHINVLYGTATGAVRVKEFTDHRAFIEHDLKFDFKPFFQLNLRVSFVDVIVNAVLWFFTGGTGNAAKAGIWGARATGFAARAAPKAAKGLSRMDGLLKSGTKWVVDKAADELVDGKWLGALGDQISENRGLITDMLAKRLELAFKPPADLFFEINTRLDLEGHFARSTPTQEKLAPVTAPIATFDQVIGVGGEARTVMGGGRFQLSIELIVTAYAKSTARGNIEVGADDEIIVTPRSITTEPTVTATLCSPLGEFTPEVLKIPKLELKCSTPKTRVFPEPSVAG